MRATAIDTALAAANPVPPGSLAGEGIETAGAQLLAVIMAEPAAAPRRRRTLAAGRTRLALVAAAALAALAAILGFALSDGTQTGQTPAYGAELVRYAENSPLVLLQLAGWHVIYANEEAGGEGEMHFAPEGVSESDALGVAELHWRVGPLSSWEADRAASSNLSRKVTVLGTEGHVYRYAGGTPSSSTFTAFWLYNGRVLEFRAQAENLGVFEAMLAALHAVDEDTWLSAMPASVIDAAQHPATVQAMLVGIPLPPGFDAARIAENGLTQDRYQLGAAVAGTVACMWLERWLEGRRSGDAAEVQGAIAALASARSWPLLHEMQARGAYPQVLEEYAADMPSANWYGHPLAAAAQSGLGCPSLGVPLSLTRAEGGYGLHFVPQSVHARAVHVK